ncbi:ABC transporter ATP-binding protein [Leucobacter luti]|uniref:NitT/TauT family transport system ATP-binding protein n=1 Tax=Leucobacter luti TaxID=340320 RepID=A0A4R6RTH4_9MICO|nr:ABC transporter ATP-binding protein [Leucobacter luti]MCW2287922.1 NitT/TauT family transport system ATP-binding protein [Leucobacter luti]QYM76080.1 ABC transporter ATP-binding protein [Leucobacter luti]TCK45916.1 NitT/TauT family transport system ATP-binding protein [Leucobacter luti]TDP90191.1 NitT/TauT family transport system ATP-binding protein [Leucobacter luti]
MSGISIQNLWKAFPSAENRDDVLVAVQDVSLEVAEREFVCVLGPSGCGKSTLLRVAAGLEQPSLGTVETDSRPSVVFQEHGVFPWLTVAENVAYPLKLRRMPRAQRRDRVAELLDLVGLTDFASYYPAQISGGMRQRTSVARALADDGNVLLMDEPFGALDEQTRVALQQELLRIWEQTSKSVLFITHSVDEALTLADRVVVMSHRPGRIIEEIEIPFGRPRDIKALRLDPRYAEITVRLWDLLEQRPEQEEAA